jgi:hypothetical protein
MIEHVVNTNRFPYRWVTIYNADSEANETLAHLDCFYKATEFIKTNGLKIVYLDDLRKQGGQKWGVRKV